MHIKIGRRKAGYSLQAQLMSLSWIRYRHQQLEIKHNGHPFHDRPSRSNEHEPIIAECLQFCEQTGSFGNVCSYVHLSFEKNHLPSKRTQHALIAFENDY